MATGHAVSDETFQQHVLQAQGLVLVDFWATWCAPCRPMAPILEAVARAYAGALTVYKLNVDEHPRTAERYGVRSMPTLIPYRDGQSIAQFVGARPKGARSAPPSRGRPRG